MKKLRSFIGVGIIYIVFIFGFTFFDSIRFINKFLVQVGLYSGSTETVTPYIPTDMDPCPPPPFPPPGGGDE